MSLQNSLNRLNHPILVGYLPVGDPLALPNQAKIYADQGVDVFEIGIPYEDPFMDGELVRSSMARALAAGVQQHQIFAQAKSIKQRHRNKVVVMMGYSNICQQQLDAFGADAVDALLQIGAPADRNGNGAVAALPRIVFVPHDLPQESLAAARSADGYIMLQAAAGKTGLRHEFDMSNKARVEKLRAYGVNLPILLGVGISSADQARQAIACGADGVIIGSACIAKALQGEAALRGFLREVRAALDDAQ